MFLQHPNGYRVEIRELTEVCKDCDGSGKRQGEQCFLCKGRGCLLSDGVSGFITALLADEEVYDSILAVVQKLKLDLDRL